NNGAGDVQINAPITNGGIFFTGTPSSSVTGAIGTLSLNAVNTYSGGTTVAQGLLRANVNGALPAGGALILGTANAATAGAVIFGATNQTVGSIGLATGNPGGTNNVITGSGTLTVSSTTANSTYDGLLSGTMALVKDGSGTSLNLTQANTYTGG